MAVFYYQMQGGEEAWHEALSGQREAFIKERKPRFVTVLDLDKFITTDMKPEDIAAIKYNGPLYFDFDCPDTDTAILQFRKFLDKLQSDYEMDLHTVELFATGGRGFHVIVPQEAFMAKVPKAGIQHLPLIYKEMAFELYVDTLDMRIYSARKGRMFRVTNVVRENGKYKVPITVDEALNMSASDYDVLCSEPREAPAIKPPVFNQKLGVLYVKAEQKVAGAVKRNKSSKHDATLLAKHKGDYPPSLKLVMEGTVSPDTGFHQIAMQIAITANALGHKEERMLAACEGLVQNHASDGRRYNTPQKRRAELIRMYHYTHDNPCYTFSRGAVRKLLPEGTDTSDLDGAPEGSDVIAEGNNGDDDGLLGGVKILTKGIYKPSEEGMQKISELSFRDVLSLKDAYTHEPLGYEVELLLNGEGRGRVLLNTSIFTSKTSLHKFALTREATFSGNDNNAAAVLPILRDTAMSGKGTMYVVCREGLDVVYRPETPGDVIDKIWACPAYVKVAGEDSDNPNIMYQYKGIPNKEGLYRSDLMNAPDFKATEETARVVHALLNLNEPSVVAAILAWTVSAFQRQLYHHYYQQFPLMMVYGLAGSGKTTTVRDFMFLHYYKQSPLIRQADASTAYGLESIMMSSASLPAVIDEYKPHEMQPGRHARLKHMLRSAYNSHELSKGGAQPAAGEVAHTVRTLSLAAPCVFIGEAIEAETAMMERTLFVPVQKQTLDGREEFQTVVGEGHLHLGELGRMLVAATFMETAEDFKKRYELAQGAVVQKIGLSRNHRPVFNMTVAMAGLEFFQTLIRFYFQSHFDDKFEELKNELLKNPAQISRGIMSEASKALDTLALISRTEEPMSEMGLQQGREYALDENYLDIKVKECFIKYVAWCKRKGQMPLYVTEDGWKHGLANYAPNIDRDCHLSLLYQPGAGTVYRFSLKGLRDEQVSYFRDV